MISLFFFSAVARVVRRSSRRRAAATPRYILRFTEIDASARERTFFLPTAVTPSYRCVHRTVSSVTSNAEYIPHRLLDDHGAFTTAAIGRYTAAPAYYIRVRYGLYVTTLFGFFVFFFCFSPVHFALEFRTAAADDHYYYYKHTRRIIITDTRASSFVYRDITYRVMVMSSCEGRLEGGRARHAAAARTASPRRRGDGRAPLARPAIGHHRHYARRAHAAASSSSSGSSDGFLSSSVLFYDYFFSLPFFFRSSRVFTRK